MKWPEMRRWRKAQWLLANNRQRIDLVLRSLSFPITLAAVVCIIIQHGCFLTDPQTVWTSAMVIIAWSKSFSHSYFSSWLSTSDHCRRQYL